VYRNPHTVKEPNTEPLPFRYPLHVLKETDHVTLLVFEGRTTWLAKVDHRGIGHGSISENICEIQKTKELRDQIIHDLKNKGSGEEIVPQTEFIIHGSRAYTYSRCQVMVKGAKSLSRLSFKHIWGLPPKSLRDLRNLFEIYIHYLECGKDIDILGNHYTNSPFFQKYLRGWIALFWSENILIDQTNTPRFIDIGIWGTENHPGLKGSLWFQRQRLRGWISVMLLNLIILIKANLPGKKP
jgi:hypothetical protein